MNLSIWHQRMIEALIAEREAEDQRRAQELAREARRHDK